MGSERNATMTDQDEDEGLDEDQEDQEDLEDKDFEESEESGESEDEGDGDDSSSSSADEAPPVATPPKGRKGGAKGKSTPSKSAPSKPTPAPVLALTKDNGKSTSKAKDNGTSKAKGKSSIPPKSTATALDKSRISRLAQYMHLVTDVTRLTILNLLMVEGEMNVGDICARVEQTQPAVSHHLALLRVSGIIEPDRRGKHNFYMLTEAGKRLTKIFEYVV